MFWVKALHISLMLISCVVIVACSQGRMVGMMDSIPDTINGWASDRRSEI